MRANEFIQINELNKDTLHSYRAKADQDIDKKHRVLGPQIQAGDASAANKTAHTIGKRMSGVDRATDKLNKDGIDEQFCEDCGGSLAEHGKASRALCKSSRSNDDLGVSQLASCKSQGLRARETSKKHTIGNKRVKIKGKSVKGHKYGGPLPYNKSDS